MFKKIISSLSKTKTINLVMLPVAIGISIILVSLVVADTGHIGNKIGGFLLSLGLFVLGFMGLPMIIRKEVPWLITIRGWIAVVEGVILLLIWWGAAIGFVTLMLRAR
jgi:hypothetical protein